jgi:hypothetical protein
MHQKQLKSSNEPYPDFSGTWIGACDDYPEDILELTIEMTESSITLEGDTYPIDAITTKVTQDQFRSIETKHHLHWSQDGQELMISLMQYEQEHNLSLGVIGTSIGHRNFRLEHGKLLSSGAITYFKNGDESISMNSSCVLEKKL